MPLYLSPRSRPVKYYPVGSSAATLGLDLLPKSQVKGALQKIFNTTPKRLIQENIPATTKIGPWRDAAGVYTLPGVQSLSWGWAREVTEEYGLQAYMLLPWYTKAVVATIRGKAYLGAFNSVTDLANSALTNTILPGTQHVSDYFRDQMGELDKRLSGANVLSTADRSAHTYTQTNALISRLDIGQPGDSGGLQLLGFVSGFDVDESVTAPYLQSYTLKYLGVDFGWYLEAQARAMRQQDNTTQKSYMSNVGRTE